MSTEDEDTFVEIPLDLLPEGLRDWRISRTGKVLTPSNVVTKGIPTSDGSYVVQVPARTGTRDLRIDRLVSMTFDRASHTAGTALYHLDGDVCNNRLDNLKAMTSSQIATYEYLKTKSSYLVSIDRFDKTGNHLGTHESVAAAKRFVGDTPHDRGLGDHIRTQSEEYKGFVFKIRQPDDPRDRA